MNESAVERAEFLIEADRPEDAEREVRRSLLAHPDDSDALALLARALIMQGRGDEAVASAREAVAHDPEDETTLFVLAVALMLTGDLSGAEATLADAIAIDPEDPILHHARAELLLQANRTADALDAAGEARALAPYDADVVATYAHMLAMRNRSDEAEAAARDALAIDPENDRAHHVLGLVGLHRGNADEALVGFREALRLDPTDEAAREGVVLALKARHPVYARLLQFFLWQSRIPRQARWALLAAPFVVGHAIRAIHNDAVFFPLAVIFIGFIVLTWAADPVMTLALLATRDGRLVLSHESRIAAALFGGFIAAAVLFGIAGAVTDPHFFIITFGFVAFSLAAGNIDSLSEERRRMFYLGTAVFLFTAVVDAAIIAAGGGYNAQVVPSFVLLLACIPALWYVRLAS